jgi:hypothetical protein
MSPAYPCNLLAQEDFDGWGKLAAELETLAYAFPRKNTTAFVGLREMLCTLLLHYTPCMAVPDPTDCAEESE